MSGIAFLLPVRPELRKFSILALASSVVELEDSFDSTEAVAILSQQTKQCQCIAFRDA